MRCDRCDQGERQAVKRAKLAERDGRVAVVLDAGNMTREVSTEQLPRPQGRNSPIENFVLMGAVNARCAGLSRVRCRAGAGQAGG